MIPWLANLYEPAIGGWYHSNSARDNTSGFSIGTKRVPYLPDIENTYVASTFAFFTEGVSKFDKMYEEGKLTKLYTTNLSYIPEEIKNRPWLEAVDLSRFIAKIVNTLSHDDSISPLLDAKHKIRRLLEEKSGAEA